MARSSPQRFGWGPVVGLGAVALVSVGLAQAGGAVQLGEEPLGPAAGLLAWALETAQALEARVGRAFVAVRLPLAGLVLAALGLAWSRRREELRWGRLLGALTLGWVGQSFLAEGRFAFGALLYAAAGVVYLARSWSPVRVDESLPRRFEWAAYLGLVGLFLALALYRLDVYPPLYFDELAYLMAGRMQRGDLEAGPLEIPSLLAPDYSFERFRLQSAALFLQSAALSLPPRGILSLRLLSVAVAVTTLVIAAAAARRHFGPFTALVMTALCCVSSLFLAYARPGFYLALSPLHGALCLICVLRLSERRDVPSAVLLGLLLGSSLYLYQLSWLAPLLAASALVAAQPRWLLNPRSAALALLVGAVALALLLPGLLVPRDGLLQVLEQTPRSVFPRQEHETVQLTKPAASWDEYLAASRRLLGIPKLRLRSDGSLALQISAPPSRLESALRSLAAEGWQVQSRYASSSTALRNLVAQGSMLVFAPSHESAQFWVAAPLLNPVVTPLLFLGVLETVRRRRQPALRALLVWVLGAALLPGVVGNPVPRRVILMLPFVYALAALPLVAWIAENRPQRRRASALGVAILAAILLAAAASGAHTYFTRWYWQAPAGIRGVEAGVRRDARGAALDLVKLVRRLPDDEPILIAPVFPHVGFFLDQMHEEARPTGEQRVFVHPWARTAPFVRRISCGVQTPLTWITANTSELREPFDALRQDFVVEAAPRGPFHTLRLVRPRRNGCRWGGGPRELDPDHAVRGPDARARRFAFRQRLAGVGPGGLAGGAGSEFIYLKF